mmetsp:Transcript_40681/g.121568  ORF Transcript_40681/g.121568 Transcript_40681/m.121568 type:complete len:285 (+) Transcript_40681:1492-2346(+)
MLEALTEAEGGASTSRPARLESAPNRKRASLATFAECSMSTFTTDSLKRRAETPAAMRLSPAPKINKLPPSPEDCTFAQPVTLTETVARSSPAPPATKGAPSREPPLRSTSPASTLAESLMVMRMWAPFPTGPAITGGDSEGDQLLEDAVLPTHAEEAPARLTFRWAMSAAAPARLTFRWGVSAAAPHQGISSSVVSPAEALRLATTGEPPSLSELCRGHLPSSVLHAASCSSTLSCAARVCAATASTELAEGGLPTTRRPPTRTFHEFSMWTWTVAPTPTLPT